MDAEFDQRWTLDGNAVAGLLHEIFTVEMTASLAECANCGRQGEPGSLQAFTRSPGVVLRCPACREVVLRIVETPDAFYLEARGARYLSLNR